MKSSELEESTDVKHLAVKERCLPALPPPLLTEEYNQPLGEELEEVYEEIQVTRRTSSDTTPLAQNVLSECAREKGVGVRDGEGEGEASGEGRGGGGGGRPRGREEGEGEGDLSTIRILAPWL